jgi:hypothetical protein
MQFNENTDTMICPNAPKFLPFKGVEMAYSTALPETKEGHPCGTAFSNFWMELLS